MDAETLFREMYVNKAANIPPFEKLENHRRLVDQLREVIEAQRLALEAAAFGDLPVTEIQHPFVEVRLAIRDHDPQAVRAAALAGYQSGHYVAVKLAAEFDQDIAALVDHLETYGELMNQNQRVFMRAALAEPITEALR